MTTSNGSGSGSATNAKLDELLDAIAELKNAPPFKRAGLAMRASDLFVLVLRDLDRRIQQLEFGECDQQNDRHVDLSALPGAGRRSQE